MQRPPPGKSLWRLSPPAIGIAAAVGVVIVLLAWLIDMRLRMEVRSVFLREGERAVVEQKHVLHAALSEMAASSRLLAHLAASRLLRENSGGAGKILRQEFLGFARNHPTLEQIHLLDPAGKELIQIKRIRPPAGSTYFQETTEAIPRDLSRESWMQALFAVPSSDVVFFHPEWQMLSNRQAAVLRTGLALRGEPNQHPLGYLVATHLADDMIRKMIQLDARLQTTTYVVTADGRWIKGPGGTPVQGMEAVASVFPHAWNAMEKSSRGTFASDEAVTAFETVALSEGEPLWHGLDAPPAFKIFSVGTHLELTERERAATAPVKGWSILALCLFIPLTVLIVSDREQKRDSARIREQTRGLLQSITDTTVDGIVAGEAVRDARGDIQDFRLVFSNPSALRILKTFELRETVDERKFPLFFSPDFFARCVEVVDTGDRFETEQSAESAVLGPRWFRIVVIRLNDGVVMSFSEITHQRHTLQELRLAKDAADSANRTKSQFLTMMGHEIRTPMNGLLGFASLLERTDLSDEQKDYVATLRMSGEALLRILEDILDYSHMETEVLHLKSAPVSIRELITQVGQLFVMASGDRHLEFVTRIAPDVPEQILGDDIRLRQILVNLLGNAIKFTTRGFILIKVVRECAPSGDLLVFHVIDSGSGIAPDMIDRLFKPFSQVDSGATRRFGGTGLGLSICRRLVESMGGEIHVSTAPDRGSDFYFTLPMRVPDFPAPPSVALQKHSQDNAQKARILVVDDDAINRKLIQRMIEKIGAETELVASGAEALQAFKIRNFDLILMDIQMPEMDGIETTRRIRALERQSGAVRRTPISALTANAGEEDKERCFEAGMDDFFFKPIRIDALEKLIEKNTV